MAQNFLDRFRSSLPEVQGRQILNILRDKKDKGELQTIEEFRSELNRLTERLLSERIMPSLQLFFGEVGEVISSETYNFMLDRINDDLEAAFTEVNTIDEVLEAHKKIVGNVVLTTIQLAINQLDEQISVFEFISRNGRGLDKAQFNTFSTTENLSTPRNGELASVLYSGTSKEDDAQVDTTGERLRIGPTGDEPALLQNIEHQFDSESSATSISTQIETASIRNIIDNTAGTFWIYESLLDTPLAGGVLHKLKIDLASTQDINFILIEPVSPKPMILESVSYIDSAGSEVDLGISETVIKKSTKIIIGRRTARSVILHFRQKNYSEVQFEQGYYNSNFDDVVDAPVSKSPTNFGPIIPFLENTVGGIPPLADAAGLDPTPAANPKIKKYNYTIGFDNIKIGLSEFKKQGIFVSKKLAVDNPRQIALRVSESRAGSVTAVGPISLDEDNFDSSRFYHGSIEYSILKENLNEAGQTINLERFNILPLGQSKVIHERLDLVEKSSGSSENNIGFLRFFPDSTIVPSIYRNGTLLTQGVDWEYDTATTDTFDQEDPANVAAMRKAIRILDPTLDIYTATYTPKIGNSISLPKDNNSLIDVVSLGDSGRIRIGPSNVIFTDSQKLGQTIAKSNLYLIILIRRNSAELAQSPTVEEYLLSAGQSSASKFDG